MKTNLFSIGNRKLPKSTAIFNMGPASDCPSSRRGLCQLDCPSKCYALKAEQCYKQVLPYRLSQLDFWINDSVDNWVDRFHYETRGKIHIVRLNESGDFHDQTCIIKLGSIARALPHIRFYGYTARKDLKFDYLPNNITINGSGFMVHNRFDAVDRIKPKIIVCCGDCKRCDICTTRRGITIQNLLH